MKGVADATCWSPSHHGMWDLAANNIWVFLLFFPWVTEYSGHNVSGLYWKYPVQIENVENVENRKGNPNIGSEVWSIASPDDYFGSHFPVEHIVTKWESDEVTNETRHFHTLQPPTSFTCPRPPYSLWPSTPSTGGIEEARLPFPDIS